MKTSSVVAAILAVAASSPSLARAQATPADKALATQLYEDAGKLMSQHDYAAACPKLRESDRLDPQLGTLLHLADCYEKAGKTASAWAAFKDGAEIATKRKDARASVARDRAAALEARLSRLTVNVPAALPGIEVRLDGELIGRPLWGSASPIDPGSHRIVVMADGRREKTYDVTVPVGGQQTVAVEAGEAVAASAPAAAPAPAPRTSPQRQIAPAPHDGGSGRRTLGFVVGGVGVAGIAVGAVTGVLVLGKKSTVSDHCDASNACDTQGLDAVSSGRTLATVSTVGFIVGAVGVGAGAYLLLSGSGHSEAPVTALSTTVIPGGGGLAVLRQF